jgi:hypothetical protein
MNSTAKCCLLTATVITWLTVPARADYCHDWLGSLERTADMKADMNVGEAKGLHVLMHTQAKDYEIVLHCISDQTPKWISVSAPLMSPSDDWYYAIVRIGSALQGWKAEELEQAVRKCHHDAAIMKDGYKSPPGLECWVSANKSMVAVWPPGTK